MPLARPEAVLQRIADALQVTVATLPALWTDIANQSTKDAAADITTVLSSVGYSVAQITAADQFATWQERLAFVIAMERGSALAAYDQAAVKALDPRDMLAKLNIILIGGVPQSPDGTSAVGGISHGRTGYYDETLRRARRRW